MPLQENPNLANKRNSSPATSPYRPPAQKPTYSSNLLNVMKIKSRALISVPADLVRPRSLERELLTETPRLTSINIEPAMNMSQVNSHFREQSPQDTQRIPSARIISPSLLRSAALSFPEPAPSPEPAWSSAVGHAGTGKSGRVIERLQGDIDRLHRDKQLLKVQFEDAERANETLITSIQFLQDRNSNYEHSHETNLRQLERKERQVQDLREELKREKANTARAEERARVAAASEETWRDDANRAKSRAAQKEVEYEVMVACRSSDNDRHQNGINKIKTNLDALLRQRQEDMAKQKKLEIIAEQQKQTIQQLEELTKKLSANFKAYRNEIDSAISDLRSSTSDNETNVNSKLDEMLKVTGEMKWVMNVERDVNHKSIPIRRHESHGKDSEDRPETPTSPSTKNRSSIDMKGKFGRKRLSKASK